MRVLIVDDHDHTRESLNDMLVDAEDITVVGQASNGEQAIASCASLNPDIVLMDVRMPKMDGLSATREVHRRHPKTSVLVLTMQEDPDYLYEAIKAGASGYILKGSSEADIIAAIRRTHDGDSPMDERLSARLLRRLAEEKGGGAKSDHRSDALTASPLSPRELEVLALLKLGYTNRWIAMELGISRGTVKRHVEHIIFKLQVSDRTQAVVKGLELGLLYLSD